MVNKIKWTAVLTTIVLIISQFSVLISAEETIEVPSDRKAVDYLTLLGIVDESEAEAFGSEEPITKGEAAFYIVKALGMTELSAQLEVYDGFRDLAPEQKYAEIVSVAVNQGILSGNPDSTLELDSELLVEQAVKMLVAALGYQTPAMMSGGYPAGYLVTGNRIGVLQNINVTAGKLISKKLFAKMLYNSFSVKLYKNNYESDQTLEDQFLDAHELEIREGIVEATKDAAVLGSPKLNDGFVIVGGEKLRSRDDKIVNFLGYHVRYLQDTKTDELIRFYITNKNVVTILDKDEEPEYQANKIKYQDMETGKTLEMTLNPNAVFLFNNRRLTLVTSEKLDFTDCDVTLIDNDNDGDADIVIWKKSISAIVSGSNEASELIYLEQATSDIGPSIDLNDQGGDRKIVVRTTDGEAIDWKSIQPEDAISVIESEDKLYLEIILLPEPFYGIVTEIIAGDSIVIDETSYDMTSQLKGLELGRRGKFYINEEGAVFKVDYDVSEYVYIIKKSDDGSSVSPELKIKIYDNFSGIHIYEVDDNVNVDGVRANGSNLSSLVPVDTVANLTVSSDGKVKKIITAAKFGGRVERKYCKYASAFNEGVIKDEYGIETGVYDEPFKFNSDTLFFAVPEDKTDDNFGAVIDFKDGTPYNTQAYECDPDTDFVKAVVVTFKAEDFVKDDPRVGIVAKVSEAINEEGEQLYFVEGFYEGEKFRYAVEDGSDLSGVVSSLKQGDVISFNKNYSDEIIQLERLVSLRDQLESIPLASGSAGSFFGTVMFLKKEAITDLSKYLYNELQVSATASYSDMTTMRIYAHLKNTEDDDYQFDNYYIYDRKRDEITHASIDDVIAYNKSTTNPSKVYIYNSNSSNGVKAKILVIVED